MKKENKQEEKRCSKSPFILLKDLPYQWFLRIKKGRLVRLLLASKSPDKNFAGFLGMHSSGQRVILYLGGCLTLRSCNSCFSKSYIT